MTVMQADEDFYEVLGTLIQLYARDKDECLLELCQPSQGAAYVGLNEGRVVFAQFGELKGEDAFHEIMRWRSGQIVHQLHEECPINIDKPLSELMLDTYWYTEEHGLLQESGGLNPPSSLAESTSVFDLSEPSDPNAPGETRRRYLWSEQIRTQLELQSDLLGLDLLDCLSEPLETLSHAGKTHMLPPPLLASLGEMARKQEAFEMMLTWQGRHHIVVPLAAESMLLHATFDASEVNLATARWRIEAVFESDRLGNQLE